MPLSPDEKTDLRKRAFVSMDLGLLAILLAGALVVKVSLATKHSVEATGTIVYDGRAHTPKSDRIRVQFAAGDQIVQLEETLGARSSLGIGDSVSVQYEANDPRRARLAENLWLFPLLLIAVGAGAIVYSMRLRKQADDDAGATSPVH